MNATAKRKTKTDMAIWDGADNVEVGEARTPDAGTGDYLLEFVAATSGTSKKNGKDYVRFTVKVLEAKPGSTLTPGTTGSFAITKGKYDFHLKEQISLTRALIGEPAAKVTGDMLKKLYTTDDAVGSKFRMVAKAVPGKFYDNGDPIVNREYFPHQELTAAAIPATSNTKLASKAK